MNKLDRLVATFNRESVDRNPFWKGNPTEDMDGLLSKHYNIPTNDPIELSSKMGDDFVWLMADMYVWKHPEGKGMFDFMYSKKRETLSQGHFADMTVEDVEKLDWPNPDYLDFTEYIKVLDKANENGIPVFGGLWSCFFHNAADFFGMEEYFIKMYTEPEVVHAVTNKIVDFYLEANKRCFEACKDKLFGFFLGNDFGTQRDLLISPEKFNEFVLPGFQKLIRVGKDYDLKVMLHSCGAIDKVIPSLIDAGIDALHPLQAKALGMEPENLLKYKDDIIFVGGVDTQWLLPNGSADEIKNEVRKLKSIFGNGYIVSPSHEALQTDIPLENVLALKEASTEN